MLLIGLGELSARYVALGGRSNIAGAAMRIAGQGDGATDPAGFVRPVDVPQSSARRMQGCRWAFGIIGTNVAHYVSNLPEER